MRAISGLWRWRHNPLRRTTDLVEAWVAGAAVLLMTLAVPTTGWICGALTDDALLESARAQAAQRQPTTARVLRAAPARQSSAGDPEGAVENRVRRTVVAEWTAPDGGSRSGTLATGVRTADPGDTFPIWTDERGNPVSRPIDRDTALAHAVVAGLGAAVLAAGLVEGGRRLIVWRLMRRRYADLDRAWAKSGPDWGRTGAGS
ncbi:Rv1733c family protein [Streptomyces pratisoli]|uniref:Uncharacterized protein n=1 Tax=Streptomyces pratisoli TaxID=3139917 RepID=A0ACC6QB23_9ACTN